VVELPEKLMSCRFLPMSCWFIARGADRLEGMCGGVSPLKQRECVRYQANEARTSAFLCEARRHTRFRSENSCWCTASGDIASIRTVTRCASGSTDTDTSRKSDRG